MAISRRGFITAGAGAGVVVGGYYLTGGRLLGPWTRDPDATATAVANGARLLLHNNENPLGPGTRAIEAMRATMEDTHYPLARYSFPRGPVQEALAGIYSCETNNLLLGCGSTQLLRSATHAFTSADRPLVMGTPSYEECPGMARVVGSPIVEVPLTGSMHLDLEAMADASRGAGLVFLCNPNNPTATVHSSAAVHEFVDNVLSGSPETTILIDEAYHDYVTDPSYATEYQLALDNPRVVVARTFSKAYGMAGLRVGYVIGQPDTIREMSAVQFGMSMNVMSLAAAAATLEDPQRLADESRRNTEARQFTTDWFTQNGFESTDSQTNFLFVNTGMPAADFRSACAEHGVLVGRDFPPFEQTHARISIGTMAEMQEAVGVFAEVLNVNLASSAA
jgi:histidinol-phosphate aminotransferase